MINKSQGHQVPEYRFADLHRVNTAHDRHAQGKAEERRPRPAPVLSACPGPQATALQDGAPRSEHGLGGIFEIELVHNVLALNLTDLVVVEGGVVVHIFGAGEQTVVSDNDNASF